MSTKDIKDKLSDFSAIEKSDKSWKGNELFHYTGRIQSVKGILAGKIRATDIRGFWHNDENEGVLILKEIEERAKRIHEYDSMIKQIDTDEKKKKFLEKKVTYVVCFSMNGNSRYMIDQYGSYEFVFDRKKLIDSLYVTLGDGSKRDGEIFKHAPVIYSEIKHNEIIEMELDNLSCLVGQKTNENSIIKKMMYLGSFFKCKLPYYREEEYRVLLNTVQYNEYTKAVLPERKEESNVEAYIEVGFDPSAVKKLVIHDRYAAARLIEDYVGVQIELA